MPVFSRITYANEVLKFQSVFSFYALIDQCRLLVVMLINYYNRRLLEPAA